MDVELAELTPPGRGAVSVVRVRGRDAAELVRELCAGVEIAPGVPRLVRLRLDGEDLDEALVCRLPAGEFELHLHGSPVLVQRLARRFAARRGPMEASLDLEALAAADLPRAQAEGAARILLDQAEGALSRELRALAGSDALVRERAIEELLRRWETARFALRPAVVVLAGPANAGKSTLFNVLLGEGRAIVHEAPGTTRDVLRERALLGAWPVWLVDTAGERELAGAGDEAEREGQARGIRARAEADLVLHLVPASPAAPEPAPATVARTAVVRTFADRLRGAGKAGAISALRDPDGARASIADLFRRTFALPEDPWVPGAAVPFTEDLAAAVFGLRGRSGSDLERAVEAIVVQGAPRRGTPFARGSPPA